jgi:hypothetical protein
MRYRLASIVPGRKRPSSIVVEETVEREVDPTAAAITSVSADVASSRAAHQEQKFPPVFPRPQVGHLMVPVMNQPILAAPSPLRNSFLQSPFDFRPGFCFTKHGNNLRSLTDLPVLSSEVVLSTGVRPHAVLVLEVTTA